LNLSYTVSDNVIDLNPGFGILLTYTVNSSTNYLMFVVRNLLTYGIILYTR